MSNDKDDVNPFFNPSDFATDIYTVVFQNTTSRTAAIPHDQVKLEEIDEHSVVLGVPKTSCNVNHNLTLEIYLEDSQNRRAPIRVQATGKVVEIEPSDDKAFVRARVTFIQYEEEFWLQVLAVQEARQKAIQDFFNQARG